MSNAKVIFTLEGTSETIECFPEEKMRDICQKYADTIRTNFNLLVFLYNGNQLKFNLSFREQANSTDK